MDARLELDEVNDREREAASIAASDWLRQAVEDIDLKFGDGYAKERPELVAGWMAAAGSELAFQAAKRQAKAVKELVEVVGEIGSGLHRLGTGDAATRMGALEFVGAKIAEAGERIADALSSMGERNE